MRVLVGTSGYSYPSWKGRFYPKKCKAAEMLAFYAGRFPSVELNSTFYTMPTAESLAPLVAQVPPTFRFAVKAPQRITHQLRLKPSADPSDDPSDALGDFVTAARALGKRLAPLLFQLPPNFKSDLPRLGDFLERLAAHRLACAFEFRHPSWFAEPVYKLLRRHKVALCVAESELLATPRVATARFGYLRLRKDDYTEGELADYAAWIRSQSWTAVYVYFKHEDTARGTVLAMRLMELCG